MQFASREDIEAPIAEVFAMLAEFEAFERSALRRGIEVQRVKEDAPQAPGMEWNAAFSMRGKHRQIRLVLAVYDPPNAMRFDSDSQGLNGTLAIDLLALSPRRTRMSINLTLDPRTLSSRLFVQSLKLAKTNLTKRFRHKIGAFAKLIEDRCTRLA